MKAYRAAVLCVSAVINHQFTTQRHTLILTIYHHVLYSLYGLLTIEITLAVEFGRNVDVINGEADELVECSQGSLASGSHDTKTVVMTLYCM